jgi:hypothetical protein
MKEDANMNTTFALLFAVLMGANGFLAIDNFIDGNMGLFALNAVATIWCLVCMVKNLWEGN